MRTPAIESELWPDYVAMIQTWRRQLPLQQTASSTLARMDLHPALLADILPVQPEDVIEPVLAALVSTRVPGRIRRPALTALVDAGFLRSIVFMLPRRAQLPDWSLMESRLSGVGRQIKISQTEVQHAGRALEGLGWLMAVGAGVDDARCTIGEMGWAVTGMREHGTLPLTCANFVGQAAPYLSRFAPQSHD